MTKLAINGVAGRMGKAILTLALKDKSFQLSGGIEAAGHASVGADLGTLAGQDKIGVCVSSNIEEVLKKSDVLIDFTHFSITEKVLSACLKNNVRYVLGTTGLEPKTLKALEAASSSIGIVQSPNMSIGVNILFKLAEITGKALDEEYDIEINETHHRLKKDAPSGTALKLLEILARARQKDLKKDVVYSREGETGARPKGQIGVSVQRGGDVVGDHTVFFLADGERIELTHKASSRDAFASGALKAAKYVAAKKNGLYNMSQVLGIA